MGRYQTQLQFYKLYINKWLNIRDQVPLLCQYRSCRNCCSAHSTPICIETTSTQLRPHVWPIDMERAPAKTCNQLRHANQFRTSTSYVSPSQCRAICSCPCIRRVPTQPAMNQDIEKTLPGCSAQSWKATTSKCIKLGVGRGKQISWTENQFTVHYLKHISLPVKKFTGSLTLISHNSESYVVLSKNNKCS